MDKALRRVVLVLVLVLLGALAGSCVMPNDVQDWSSHQQSFKRTLYPVGSSGLNPPTPSFTTAAGASATPSFALPPGTVAVRILATANGLKFSYQLLLVGHQTQDQYFGDPNAPGSRIAPSQPTLPFTIPVDVEWDSQIDLGVTGDASQTVNYFVSALFQAEAPGQAGSSTAVFSPTPASWQAPTVTQRFAGSVPAGGSTVILSPVPNGIYRLFGPVASSDAGAGVAGDVFSLEDTNGTQIQDFRNVNTLQPGSPGPLVVATGAGVRVHNFSTAALVLRITFGYSLGS